MVSSAAETSSTGLLPSPACWSADDSGPTSVGLARGTCEEDDESVDEEEGGWVGGPGVSVLVSGASTKTMLPHFGQDRIWPMADSSRTRSRAWQVVHWMENGSTKRFPSSCVAALSGSSPRAVPPASDTSSSLLQAYYSVCDTSANCTIPLYGH